MDQEVILCVDDDGPTLNALRSILSRQPVAGRAIEIAESGEEAMELFADLTKDGDEVSVVISDYIMPGMKGDELLVRVHQQCPDTIKIMLTGQSDIHGVKRAINEAGLYRFLEKPFNNADFMLTVQGASRAFHLGREVRHKTLELERLNLELERHNMALETTVAERTAELLAMNKELELLSATDRLTGLANRLRLDTLLEQELARCQRQQGCFSLILLDIDKFKNVNDSHGHQVGDTALIEVGRVLKGNVRQYDVVGRWGGKSFSSCARIRQRRRRLSWRKNCAPPWRDTTSR